MTFESTLAMLVEHRTVSRVDPQAGDDPRVCLDAYGHVLAQAGASVEVWPNPERPQSPILAAYHGMGAPCAVLAGHLDTVPAIESTWRGDPWQLVATSRTWHGLGVADMKGFFAVVADVLSARPPQAPCIQVLATTDEESGMQAAQYLAREARLPGVPLVLGEPTGGRRVRATKGIWVGSVMFRGKTGHASLSGPQGTAMQALRPFLAELDALRETWGRQQRRAVFDPPWPTINIGKIQGGDAFNRIAPEVELSLEVRLLGHLTPEQVETAVSDAAEHAAQAAECTASTRRRFAVPTFDGGAVDAAQAAPFSCEAGYYQQAGAHVCVWGPGAPEQAHQPDEALDKRALETYHQALTDWLEECRGDA